MSSQALLYMLRGVCTEELDVKRTKAQLGDAISRFMRQFPRVWEREEVLYIRTSDCSFEIVSASLLEHHSDEVKQASKILRDMKPSSLKALNISHFELRPLTPDGAQDLRDEKRLVRPIAIAIDPDTAKPHLKDFAAELYRKGCSNYPGSSGSADSMSRTARGGSSMGQPSISSQRARPAVTEGAVPTLRRPTKPSVVKPAATATRASERLQSSSAGPSRTQRSSSTRPAVATINNGRTSGGETLAALREENEQLKQDHAALRKRYGEDIEGYERALKKARTSQRSILRDDEKDIEDQHLDAIVTVRAATMKEKMVDMGLEIAALVESGQELEEEVQELNGEVKTLKAKVKTLEVDVRGLEEEVEWYEKRHGKR